MGKATASILCGVAAALLAVTMLFTALRIVMNDEAWFEAEYAELGVAEYMGMSAEDVTASMTRLIDYMEGRVPDIVIEVGVNGERAEMFNKRETDHMVDVQRLFMLWRTFGRICSVASLAILSLVFVLRRREGLPDLCRGWLWGSAAFVVVFAAIAVYAVSDFSAFWTRFHHLFFTNDLWLLDPATSRMINICPEQLFYDIVTRFGLMFAGAFALLNAGAGAYLIIRKRNSKRAAV